MARRFEFRPDVVSVALAGLIGWTAVQLVPLPESLVAVVSPTRADWHRTLLPAVEEAVGGEAGAVRSGLVPLSADPSATRALLARLLGVFLVYAAARNWLADRDSLPRFLLALALAGAAVAGFAVLQLLTAPPETMYWSVPMSRPVFGPFVNKNHYADFAALAAGAAVGLALRKSDGDRLPRAVGFGLVAAFVVLTVPLSLSRGGTLAVAAAGAAVYAVTRVGGDTTSSGWGRVALTAAAGLLLLAVATLGSSAVEGRLATLSDRGELEAGRLGLWRDALRLVPGVPLAGTGGGTFGAVEPLVRRDARIAVVNYEFAHNEYLEALVEGGAVRLGLTLALAVGLVAAVIGGAVRRADRSVGGPLAGLGFGLAAVALHAAAEFAVHMPAVAVAAAACAGFAVAAATDGGFVPSRLKVRTRKSADGAATVSEPVAEETPPPDRKWVGRDGRAYLPAGLVLLAALLTTLDARSRKRAAAYEEAAEAVAAGRFPADDRTALRVTYADACAAARPDAPGGRLVAAEAHLQAAYEAGGGTVPGGPSVAAAVRHLQAARRASPIATRAHARLGLLAGQFVGEPARVHFDRAKRLWPADPEVFYAAGREALGRGDTAAALADWQRSLAGSPARLGDILKAVKGVPADELRRELVPDLAAAQVIAADALFPDRLRQADDRRPFLVDAVRLAEANDGPTAADWAAAAKAADELRRPDAADSCWQRAAAAAPKDVAIRDGYARWLEREERWEAAVEQLRELQKLAGVASVQDRIEGCYHALKLKRLIGD